VGDVTRYEREMLAAARDKAGDVLEAIRTDKAIKPETEEKLKKFLEGFAKSFA
jgi:F-type H+-transporting ATPase subunit alpha